MDFKILDDTGKEIECELIYTFKDKNNDINYIIYTDGKTNNDGKKEVYASRYELKDGNYILKAIENDNEWDLIDNILTTKIKICGD